MNDTSSAFRQRHLAIRSAWMFHEQYKEAPFFMKQFMIDFYEAHPDELELLRDMPWDERTALPAQMVPMVDSVMIDRIIVDAIGAKS